MSARTAAIIALAIAATAALGACGGSKPKSNQPPEAAPIDAPPAVDASIGATAIATFADFRAQMCACKDKACADQVTHAMEDWENTYAERYKDYKPTEAEMKQMVEIADGLAKCTMGYASPGAVTDAAEAIAKMRELTDAMCACKDTACADKVGQDLADWGSANADRFRDYSPSGDELKQMNDISQRLTQCTQKLYSATTKKP